MKLPVPSKCHICGEELTVEKVGCDSCGCSVECRFGLPRLGRLTQEEQAFVELFVSLSGNLKKLAAALGVSYPTVRTRLDGVIDSLERLSREDQDEKESLLDRVENGEISPSLAARILEET